MINNRKNIITYLLIIAIAFIASIGNVEAIAIINQTTPSAYDDGGASNNDNTTNNQSQYSCFIQGNTTCYGTLVTGDQSSSGITYSGGTYSYTEKYIRVITNAGLTKDLDAMCIDPQKSIKVNSTYTCTKISTRYGPAAYKMASYLANKFELNTLQKDLVYRILAKAAGYAQANDGKISDSIQKYIDSGFVDGNGLSNVPTKVHDAAQSAVNIYYLTSGAPRKINGTYVSTDPGFTYTISESESDYDKNEFKVYVSTKNPQYLVPTATISFKAVDINDKDSVVGTVDQNSVQFNFATGKGSFTLKLRDSKHCSGIKMVATEAYDYISEDSKGYTYKCCPNSTSDAQCLIVNMGGTTTTGSNQTSYTTEVDSFCKKNTCGDIPGKSNATKNFALCNSAKNSGIYSGTCKSNTSSSDWYDNDGNKLSNYDAWVASCTNPTCNTIPNVNVRVNGKSTSAKDACNSYKSSGTLLGNGTCTVVDALNGKWYDNDGNKLSNYSAWVSACTKKVYSCSDIPKGKTDGADNIKLCKKAKSNGIYSGECNSSTETTWYKDGNVALTDYYDWLNSCTSGYQCQAVKTDGKTTYYGKNGKVDSEQDMLNECFSCYNVADTSICSGESFANKCKSTGTRYYYYTNGDNVYKTTSKKTWKNYCSGLNTEKSCNVPTGKLEYCNSGLGNRKLKDGITCVESGDSSWYNISGSPTDKAGWLKSCTTKTTTTTPNKCSVPAKSYCTGKTIKTGSCDLSKDGYFYDDNGDKIEGTDAETKWEDACVEKTSGHYCEVVTENGKKIYYDKTGAGSDDDKDYRKQCLSCSVPEGWEDYCESTGRTDCTVSSDDPSDWHDSDGNETDKDGWDDSCKNGGNNNPNTCKTSITTPEICDNAENKTIEIDSPEDVNSCIIGKSDDNNDTYQDTTISSPYCTVYCKEDYTITLPGAQYTTSGRYFSVSNINVNGTRTCYAASPDGENTGIDTAKYNKAVAKAQEDLFEAYNEYSRQKALSDNASSATETITTDCLGNEYKLYTLSNVEYEIYNYNCNEQTGKCTYSKTSTTTSATWGDTASTINSSGVSRTVIKNRYETDALYENAKIDALRDAQQTAADDSRKTFTGCETIGSGASTRYVCRITTCTESVQNKGSEPSKPSDSTIIAAQSNLEKIIKDMEKCYNFGDNYTINPDIAFSYDEEYIDDFGFTFGIDESATTSDTTKVYGTGLSNKNDYTVSGTKSLENINYIKCDENGCSIGTEAKNISSTIKYVKSTTTKKVVYESKTELQTNYPHGTIDKVTDKTKLIKNYSYLGAVFPVAMSTDEGVYKWQLNITNLGTKSTGESGRIDAIANKLGVSVDSSIQYVCVYAVDCDDCEYTCKCPEGVTNCTENQKTCTFDDDDKPKCTDCEVYCKNCIFNGDTTYTYRTVSLNNLFPTSRQIGSNWSSTKGQDTAKAISDKGEDAYITPEYSFTLTATNMQNIRNYNSTAGTYVDDDLNYTEVTVNGVTYYVGTSDFLKNGVTNKYFDEATLNTDWTSYSGTITDGSGPAWK